MLWAQSRRSLFVSSSKMRGITSKYHVHLQLMSIVCNGFSPLWDCFCKQFYCSSHMLWGPLPAVTIINSSNGDMVSRRDLEPGVWRAAITPCWWEVISCAAFVIHFTEASQITLISVWSFIICKDSCEREHCLGSSRSRTHVGIQRVWGDGTLWTVGSFLGVNLKMLTCTGNPTAHVL